MTPKEKAKELVDYYWLVDSDNDSALYTDSSMSKKCALRAVDEILDVLVRIFESYEERKYWEQVKQEIELL